MDVKNERDKVVGLHRLGYSIKDIRWITKVNVNTIVSYLEDEYKRPICEICTKEELSYVSGLSYEEMDILNDRLKAGWSNRKIAKDMHTTPQRISKKISVVYGKSSDEIHKEMRKEIMEKAYEMYVNGTPFDTIFTELNISKHSFYKWLRENHPELKGMRRDKSQSKISGKDLVGLIAMYENHMPIELISSYYGVHPTTVKRLLTDYNIAKTNVILKEEKPRELTNDTKVIFVSCDNEQSIIDIETVEELEEMIFDRKISEETILERYDEKTIEKLLSHIGNDLNYIMDDIVADVCTLGEALETCGDLMNEYEATLDNAKKLYTEGISYLWHDGSNWLHGEGPQSAFIYIPTDDDDLKRLVKNPQYLDYDYLKISESDYVNTDTIAFTHSFMRIQNMKDERP